MENSCLFPPTGTPIGSTATSESTASVPSALPADSTVTSESTAAVPSALPSRAADIPDQPNSPVLNDMGMLILLLRLTAILNNKNGEASLQGFKQAAAVGGLSLFPFDEVDFIPLDAVSAILVQQHEVIAVGYQENTPSNVVFNRDRMVDEIPANLKLQPHLPDDFGVPVTEHLNPPRFKPKFTITANPRSDLSAGNPVRARLHNLRLIKTGEDDGHWPEILSNPQCRLTEGPTTLEKHISTVCAYLNDYRSHPSVQSDYSNRFFKYLLTVCWPKLYRRISCWRGLGFIYELLHCRFDSQSVKDADWGDAEYDMSHEKYLRRFISQYQNIVNGLKSVFTWPGIRDFHKGGPIHFQELVSAAELDQRLYTRNTANEFHYFVFAAFVMFGHSLSCFDTAVNKAKAAPHNAPYLQKAQKAFLGLQAQTTLVLYLVTSSTFARHMEVFHSSRGLRELVPDFNRREEYKKFGRSMKIYGHDKVTGRSSAKSNPGESDVKVGGRAEENDGNATKVNNSGAAANESKSDEMEDPSEALNVESFIGWLKTFIVQFIAKRVLELQCRKRPAEPIEMTLLSVDRIAFRVPPWTSFEDMIKDVIRKIASPTISCSAVQVIQIIAKGIEEFKASNAEVKAAIDMFRAILKKKSRLYTVGSHCETLLAVLMTLKSIPADSDFDDPELIRICEGLHGDLIAVSKLCCPVCWYALAALREDDENLFIRGCHSTMYGLVLPPILDTNPTTWNTIDGWLKSELRKSISDLVKSVQADPENKAKETLKKPKHRKQESHTSMDYGYSSSSSIDSLNDRDLREVEYPLDQHAKD